MKTEVGDIKHKKKLLSEVYFVGKDIELTERNKTMKKQTAGRDALGSFAPKFAELNDDVLFGEVWSREDKLSLRDRSIIANDKRDI